MSSKVLEIFPRIRDVPSSIPISLYAFKCPSENSVATNKSFKFYPKHRLLFVNRWRCHLRELSSPVMAHDAIELFLTFIRGNLSFAPPLSSSPPLKVVERDKLDAWPLPPPPSLFEIGPLPKSTTKLKKANNKLEDMPEGLAWAALCITFSRATDFRNNQLTMRSREQWIHAAFTKTRAVLEKIRFSPKPVGVKWTVSCLTRGAYEFRLRSSMINMQNCTEGYL